MVQHVKTMVIALIVSALNSIQEQIVKHVILHNNF
jgi:hypothetical protein